MSGVTPCILKLIRSRAHCTADGEAGRSPLPRAALDVLGGCGGGGSSAPHLDVEDGLVRGWEPPNPDIEDGSGRGWAAAPVPLIRGAVELPEGEPISDDFDF
jgi:hypothetical protein